MQLNLRRVRAVAWIGCVAIVFVSLVSLICVPARAAPDPTTKPGGLTPQVAMSKALSGANFQPGIFGMVAGIPTLSLSDLLSNEAALARLRLSESQIGELEKIREDARQFVERRTEQLKRYQQMSQEERAVLREEPQSFYPAQQKRLWNLLDPEQRLLARNILFQLNGELSLAYVEVARELNITPEQMGQMKAISELAVAEQQLLPQLQLTPEQRAALKRLDEEKLHRMRARRQGEPNSWPEDDADLREAREKIIPPPTEAQKAEINRLEEIRARKIREQVKAVFTAEQVQQWDDVRGAPLDAELLAAIKRDFLNAINQKGTPERGESIPK